MWSFYLTEWFAPRALFENNTVSAETRGVSFVRWILLSSRGHKTEQHAWKDKTLVFHNTQTAHKTHKSAEIEKKTHRRSVLRSRLIFMKKWRSPDRGPTRPRWGAVSSSVQTVALLHHSSESGSLIAQRNRLFFIGKIIYGSSIWLSDDIPSEISHRCFSVIIFVKFISNFRVKIVSK